MILYQKRWVMVMFAKYEKRNYDNDIPVWAGKYDSLQNIAHWHKESEIIYVNKGITIIGINGKIYTAHEGDCFICNSGDIHYINSSPGSICTVIIFDNKITNVVLSQRRLKSPKLKNNYGIDNFYLLIKNELKHSPMFFEEKIKSAFVSLIINIFRNEYTEANSKT